MGMGEALALRGSALASACVSQPDVILRRVLKVFLRDASARPSYASRSTPGPLYGVLAAFQRAAVPPPQRRVSHHVYSRYHSKN